MDVGAPEKKKILLDCLAPKGAPICQSTAAGRYGETINEKAHVISLNICQT